MAEHRFEIGDEVRVRPGISDPDYPDVPLGGWAGTVTDIDTTGDEVLFVVDWNEETLDALPDFYWHRCDRDGLDPETTLLRADDLVPDDGTPLAIEPITRLTPRPLDLDDPEERALSVLGLTSDDVLPEVSMEGLERYYEYLKAKLKVPFLVGLDMDEAQVGTGLRPVMVTRILPAAQSLPVVGLMAEVAVDESRMEVPLVILQFAQDDPAIDDIDAYAAWIGQHVPDRPERSYPGAHPFLLIAILTALVGGVIGAAAATVPGAQLGALIGAGLVAILGFWFGSRLETLFRFGNQLNRPTGLGGAAIGFLGGAGVGAAIGVASVSFYASVPGAILGTLLGAMLRRMRLRGPSTEVLTFAGAGLGTVGAALLYDWREALAGLGWGLLGGAVGGGLLVGAVLLYLSFVFYQNSKD